MPQLLVSVKKSQFCTFDSHNLLKLHASYHLNAYLYFSVSLRQGLPEDPYSHEYRESQLRLYELLAGKPYIVANEETPFDFEKELQRPFPYGTQSYQTVGDYLMSYGYAIKTLNLPP